jgi:ATP-binding protein involved in chromosome partitioning
MLSNAIKQLIHKTEWGELDILFVDMPPGTGDAYITIANELNIDGVIFISTNNKLSIHDTIKSINTCKKLKIPIIGAIQNSTYPHNNDEKLVLSHQIQQITSIDFNEKIYNMNFNNTFLESLNLKEIYENIIHG